MLRDKCLGETPTGKRCTHDVAPGCAPLCICCKYGRCYDSRSFDEIIPTFNEIGSNPLTALDMVTRDGVILRFKLPSVQQSRVMVAMCRLLASLGVELDIELPEAK